MSKIQNKKIVCRHCGEESFERTTVDVVTIDIIEDVVTDDLVKEISCRFICRNCGKETEPWLED